MKSGAIELGLSILAFIALALFSFGGCVFARCLRPSTLVWLWLSMVVWVSTIVYAARKRPQENASPSAFITIAAFAAWAGPMLFWIVLFFATGNSCKRVLAGAGNPRSPIQWNDRY